MRRVSISELKPGKRVEESIYLSFGCLYLPKGAIVEEKTINRLKNIGIEELFISEDETPEKELSNYYEKEEAKKSYNLCLESTQEIMDSIYNRKVARIEEINETIDLIAGKILSKSDILVSMIEMKKQDSYLYCHSINVCILASMLGKWMGYSEQKLHQLITAGLLHDIGMMHVYSAFDGSIKELRDSIEDDRVKKHSLYGYEIVNKIKNINRNICQAVLLHHERQMAQDIPLEYAKKIFRIS